MARKKTTETKHPIESYEHQGKQRVNNPPVGLVTPETDPDAGAKKTYAYDPHLQWVGKAGHTSFEVPTVSLPFELGEHWRLTVKIVDDRGIESLKILEVE